MQHMDRIILQKVIAEINIGINMLGTCSLNDF